MLAAGSIRETVNYLIDGLFAAAGRLLDLPLFVVLLAVGVLAGLLVLSIRWLARRRPQSRWLTPLRALGVLLVVLALAFVVDQRIASLQSRLDRMQARQTRTTAALLDAIARSGQGRRRSLLGYDAVEQRLRERFGAVALRPMILDDATDLLQVHIDRPRIEAWLAVVDLRQPELELLLGGSFEKKSYTSDFAVAHGCSLAINGEAGLTPEPGCGLGPWQGHFVVRGEVRLDEVAGQPRPFLAFDRDNHASFRGESAEDRSLPGGTWNAIWGRVDLIVGGVVQDEPFRFNQPRTAMGIDRDGSTLFLLVVDGRQFERSWGFTRPEAGDFLAAFGVHDAMLCDEGGSSCIWLAAFGGIANVPSDHDGVERPTYTHFGIRLRPPAEAGAK